MKNLKFPHSESSITDSSDEDELETKFKNEQLHIKLNLYPTHFQLITLFNYYLIVVTVLVTAKIFPFFFKKI